MHLKPRSHVHLLGICGTAMATVAYMLKQKKFKVSGSDDVFYPPMSDFLKEHNIHTLKKYKASNLKPRPDLVVVGNSISRGNPELEAVLNQKINYVSMPELIRFAFLDQKSPVVIAGTHGKTTTTTLVAWLLTRAGLDPSYLVGGRPLGLPTSGHSGRGPHFVIEGDEYDSAYFDKRSKFLHYYPEYLVLNNLEFDHADIFADLEAIKLSFSRLLKLVPANGLVLFNGDDKNLLELVTQNPYSRAESFGKSNRCDWQFKNYKSEAGGSSFEIFYRGKKRGQLQSSLMGMFNARNQLAAYALGHHLKIKPGKCKEILGSFQGVARRQNLLLDQGGIMVYDDFAHHPSAIQQVLGAIRARHQNSRIIAAFEPRSNTSVRNFFTAQWPLAFEDADVVFFAPLHRVEKIPPAQRLPLAKICKVLARQKKKAIAATSFENLKAEILTRVQPGDVVIFMSNGAFGGITSQVVAHLKNSLK